MRVLNERQAKILESLETKRYISVSELSDKLKVSVVTIRKDLTLLEQEGYLHRTHGGASKQMRYVFDQTVSEKETLNVEEKTRIIDKALDYIKMSLSFFHQGLLLIYWHRSFMGCAT